MDALLSVFFLATKSVINFAHSKYDFKTMERLFLRLKVGRHQRPCLRAVVEFSLWQGDRKYIIFYLTIILVQKHCYNWNGNRLYAHNLTDLVRQNCCSCIVLSTWNPLLSQTGMPVMLKGLDGASKCGACGIITGNVCVQVTTFENARNIKISICFGGHNFPLYVCDTHVKESRLNIELRSIERVQGSTMNPLPNPQFAQIPFVSLCLAHRLVHRLVHRFDNLVIPILMRANLRLWGPKSTKENDDDIYPQCLACRHSLDHMFLRCQLTLSFWDFFQTWWTSEN